LPAASRRDNSGFAGFPVSRNTNAPRLIDETMIFHPLWRERGRPAFDYERSNR
jgi:hypothetical protein